MTSFWIQGATNDAFTSVITKCTSAVELFVNLDRGRQQNVLFAVANGDDQVTTKWHSAMNNVAASIRDRRFRPAIRANQIQVDPGLRLNL